MSLYKVIGLMLLAGIVFLFLPAVWSMLKTVIYIVGIYIVVDFVRSWLRKRF